MISLSQTLTKIQAATSKWLCPRQMTADATTRSCRWATCTSTYFRFCCCASYTRVCVCVCSHLSMQELFRARGVPILRVKVTQFVAELMAKAAQ